MGDDRVPLLRDRAAGTPAAPPARMRPDIVGRLCRQEILADPKPTPK